MTAADCWADRDAVLEAARKVNLWIKCGMPDQSGNTPTRDALKRDILKLIEAARHSQSGAEGGVVAELQRALEAVEYQPGDHPVVPIKHDAFVKAVRVIVAKASPQQPATSTDEKVGGA